MKMSVQAKSRKRGVPIEELNHGDRVIALYNDTCGDLQVNRGDRGIVVAIDAQGQGAMVRWIDRHGNPKPVNYGPNGWILRKVSGNE